MKKNTLIVLLLFTLTVGTTTHGQTAVSEEAVKAAFLFHFINFTEWKDGQDKYYVCIPEDERLRSAAERSLSRKMINGRRIEVTDRRRDCHVLVSDYMPATPDSTLTVGQLSRGALLEFRMIDNKLKFAVNPDKVQKSNVKISSQLLKMAILEEK